MRQVALIILTDVQKRILLQYKNSKSFPDSWAFFGGGIEPGETPIDAVKRETKEEIEYELKSPFLVYTQYDDDTKPWKYVFMEKYNGSPLVIHEGEGFQWFTINETKKIKMFDHDKIILKKIEPLLQE